MQQSNWPESQPQSHTEKEKWIKKEVGGTILDPGPASGSGSGDQQALPPQVEVSFSHPPVFFPSLDEQFPTCLCIPIYVHYRQADMLQI